MCDVSAFVDGKPMSAVQTEKSTVEAQPLVSVRNVGESTLWYMVVIASQDGGCDI